MSRQVIAKYGPFVFRCCSFYVMEKKHWYVYFADFFEEDIETFLNYYKKLYPNHSLQVFTHPKKHLNREIRLLIEEYVNHPYFLFLNRDFNLKKIFES